MSARPYTLVNVKQSKGRYEELIPRWWQWVHGPNADANNIFRDVTFLRDDIIGNQRNIDVGVDTGPVRDRFKTNITVSNGTNIFFPVYQTHICKEDPFPFGEGGQCLTIPRCVLAAENDLNNLYERSAKVNGVDITNNFKDFEIKVGPFTIDVPKGHGLKREKGYSLSGGPHEGVAHGTYILMNNFQPGTYEIEFEGKATNYRTRSEYTMTVTR